jgi:hypothetical protein
LAGRVRKPQNVASQCLLLHPAAPRGVIGAKPQSSAHLPQSLWGARSFPSIGAAARG